MRAAFPPDGTPGDDDSGAMGSLYVFLSMGLMPIAGTDLYVLSAPGEPHVVLNLSGAKRPLRIRTRGDVGKGVRRVTLDGCPVESRLLRHAELRDGGELVFVGDN